MSYREFAPPPGLSNVIECVWVVTPPVMSLPDVSPSIASPPIASRSVPESPVVSPLATPSQVILPDGAMDIIAALWPDGSVENISAVGAMTRPLTMQRAPRTTIGIRFLPGRAARVLGVNACELTDVTTPFTTMRKPSYALVDAFRLLFNDPRDNAGFERLSRSLDFGRNNSRSTLTDALFRITRQPETTDVSSVATNSNVSRQQLARLFAQHVGLTPKQFIRICRVRALLARSREQFAGWSRVAAEYGYSDQSHLTADVKAVTGLTPGEWRTAAGSIFPIAPVPQPRN